MTQMTSQPPLPTVPQLVRAIGVALVVAAVILVTAVLPAEYRIDPTGVGTALGLTRMGQVKTVLAREAEGHAIAPEAGGETAGAGTSGSPASAGDSVATRSDVTEIVLPPNQGKEIKLIMESGARADYRWSAAGGLVDFETHGEPFNAPASVYESYEKGSGATSDEGVLTAPFSGKHGWYWGNRSSSSVTIKLETRGQYREVRILETQPTGVTP